MAGNSWPEMIASYGLWAGLPTICGLSALYWFVKKNQGNRARKLLQRVKSSPGELPLLRPVIMGGEELFRSYIRASNLPQQLKDALCREGVYVGRPEYVVGLIEKMVNDGPDKFQVVTDFDATLTRYHRDGKRCDTCYGILDSSQRMPQFYREECTKLREKYYPIELDPLLTVEEKTPHMCSWWTKSLHLIVKSNFEKSWLSKMVEESSVELRERCGVLFAILDHCSIPLLIYSAGIGDLILEVLVQRCSFKNFAEKPLIVANYMRFSDKGVLEGFSQELIHTFNKHEIFPHHREYFERHGQRGNVMLMGDMIGDLRMADGMRAKENVITVGFLNSKVEESFQLYREKFDIVLIDDQSMNVPIAIVESIIRA